MFNSLRAIKLSAPIHRILLGSAIASVLALALWLALIPVAPKGNIVVAAPNLPPPPIEGLAVTNDGPKVVNDPITFTTSITQGTVATYTWDFGDSFTSTTLISTTNHAYAVSGIYTATVVAANDTSAETATTTVYVGDAVVTVQDFEFTPKNVTIPVGGTVIWVHVEGDHSVTADDNISFNQPLGDTNDWAQFSHTFNSAGTFPYHCILHGGMGMVGTIVVQAPPQPIEGLSAGNLSPATINTPIEFTTTVTNGNNITYTWDFGDGNGVNGIQEVTTTHAYTAPGTYIATVTAVNISSTVTATTTAYVGNAVVKVENFKYDPQVVTIPPGGTVVWVLAENTISHSVTADDHSFEQLAGLDWKPFVHTFASVAATDAVTVTYHCTVHSNMKGSVVISALPPAITDLTAENDGPVKLSNPVHFTAHITGGGDTVAYTWAFGDGNVGTGITATHTYTQSGIYTATVTATNATNSMQATTTALVADQIVDVADFAFTPKTVNIPVGGTVVWERKGGFHSVTADDGSFEQLAGSDWLSFAHTYNSAGTFDYHCSVHGGAGRVGMYGTVIVANPQPQTLLPQIGKNP